MSTHPFPDAHHPDEKPAPHPLLEPVLGLLGHWQGKGEGEYPPWTATSPTPRKSPSPTTAAPSCTTRPAPGSSPPTAHPCARPPASGWWRLQPDARVEALVTQPTGIAEILVGKATGGTIDLTTHEVALTPTAKKVTATRRRYTLNDESTLTFAHDLEAVGQPLQHHLSAQLHRAG